MNQKQSDALLQEAARDVCRAMADALPAPEDCAHAFSPAFDRKMRPLLRRQAYRPLLRQAAAVLLAAFVGLGAWLLVDGDARAAFLRWVREVYETHLLYRFQGEAVEADHAAYAPTWLPAGYVETERHELYSQTVIIYENAEGQQLSFSCGVMQEGAAVGVILEGAAEEAVTVSGLPGFYYEDPEGDDQSTLIWMDESLGLSFDLQTFEDFSVMLHIAESVDLVK